MVQVIGFHKGKYPVALAAADDDCVNFTFANGSESLLRLFETRAKL
jgi:hypothetical protein